MAAIPNRHEDLSAFLKGELSGDALTQILDWIDNDDSARLVLDEITNTDPIVSELRSSFSIGPLAKEPNLSQVLSQITETMADGDTARERNPVSVPDAEPGSAETGCGPKPSSADAGQASSRDSAEPPTRQLREYKLLEKIGEGGMGAVYKAVHTRLEKTVAVKILREHRLKNADMIARFQREMRAIGKLDHPYIVRATDAGDVDGIQFLVMEYIPGRNLNTVLEARGPLRVADACEIIRQAAVGLQHAFEHGLVHRDLKPANLILTTTEDPRATLQAVPEGSFLTASGSIASHPNSTAVVKILDFGLARLMTETPTSELTSEHQVIGTFDYMAPEQATDTCNVGIEADIYSLGCTLYKLLTGRTPFSGDRYVTIGAKLAAHLTADADSVQTARPDIADELARILQRMLHKDKSRRIRLPGDVATVLLPFCHGANLSQLLNDGADREEETPTGQASVKSIGNVTRNPDSTLSRHQPAKSPEFKRPMQFTIYLGLLLIGIFSYGTYIRLITAKGTLIVESTDPDLQLIIDGDRIEAKEKNQEGGWIFKLTPGKHDIAAKTAAGEEIPQLTMTEPDGSTSTLSDGRIEINRSGVVRLIARVESGTNSNSSKNHTVSASSMMAIRSVCEWAIQHRGSVVTTDGKYFNRVEDLPTTNIALSALAVDGRLQPLSQDELIDRLSHLPSLSNQLSVFHVEVDDEGLGRLVAIPGLAKVNFLELVGAEISARGLNHLRQLTKLRILNLSYNRGFKDDSIKILASIPLTHLQLSNDDLSDSQLNDLTGLSDLMFLTIRSNPRLTSAGIRQLCKLSILRQIDVAMSPVGDAGLEQLICMKELERVYLSESEITLEGFQRLGRLPNLRSLGFVAFHSLGEYASRLGAACPKLDELWIEGCTLSSSQLDPLRHVDTLRILRMRGNRVEGTLVESLEELHQLKVLEIRETAIDRADVVRIHEKLPHCAIFTDTASFDAQQ